LDEAVGLGPLEYFLEDPDATEIMVNNHQDVFIEKAGVLSFSGQSFMESRGQTRRYHLLVMLDIRLIYRSRYDATGKVGQVFD